MYYVGYKRLFFYSLFKRTDFVSVRFFLGGNGVKFCCFTGHRKLFCARSEIYPLLLAQIEKLSAQGIRDFIVGGALGFDCLAAQAVLEIGKTESVRLHLYLPCVDHDRYWTESDKEIYAWIKERAYAIKYISLAYSDTCMLMRNRAMVDASDVCVYYLTHDGRSGTAATVRYAIKKRLKMVDITKS